VGLNFTNDWLLSLNLRCIPGELAGEAVKAREVEAAMEFATAAATVTAGGWPISKFKLRAKLLLPLP